jgi:3-methyl-2-oxobutanoate hydroxymethyltransferase
MVLEGMPPDAAEAVTKSVGIPTIGIGAGNRCDGQVLVLHDLLGLAAESPPSFVKEYADLWGVASDAVKNFCREVRDGSFPDREHWYK